MTALNKQALREAAQEEIMLRSVSDTSDYWQDEASPEAVLALLDELEAAEKRIAELTGKPAEEYADDGELLFEIDFCDDLSTSIQTAQWLKELRIRRAAGIGVKGD